MKEPSYHLIGRDGTSMAHFESHKLMPAWRVRIYFSWEYECKPFISLDAVKPENLVDHVHSISGPNYRELRCSSI